MVLWDESASRRRRSRCLSCGRWNKSALHLDSEGLERTVARISENVVLGRNRAGLGANALLGHVSDSGSGIAGLVDFESSSASAGRSAVACEKNIRNLASGARHSN